MKGRDRRSEEARKKRGPTGGRKRDFHRGRRKKECFSLVRVRVQWPVPVTCLRVHVQREKAETGERERERERADG